MKISKTQYLHTFAFVTMFLAIVRCVANLGASDSEDNVLAVDTVAVPVPTVNADSAVAIVDVLSVIPVTSDFVPHRIYSVPSFKTEFPDSNEVQLQSARRYGVPPVLNRQDAERRKSELVYVGANPFFSVDPLRESIPYLVPLANVLLQDIGRAFYDSLYLKGVPLHQIIVTSVLRTEEDIARLRRYNINASENSCHRFGTTFDICYNRYMTVQTAAQPRRQVRNDTLKWVLSEVLRDMRQSHRCYIKYEVKQGCFHVTVR